MRRISLRNPYNLSDTLFFGGIALAVVLGATFGWYLYQNSPAPLSEGVVIEHRYTAQYVHEHDGGTTCVSRDSNGFCTFSVDNPDRDHDHCVGGCFELKIDGCSNNRKGQSKCRAEWKRVPPQTYDNCSFGQFWSRSSVHCRPR